MSETKPDLKPDMTVDGVDHFNIPVEEEEAEIADNFWNSKMWAMKIPRFLLERWERVDQGGVHLGTLHVDNGSNPPKVTLKLPTQENVKKEERGSKRSRLDTNGIPDEYEVVLPTEHVKNTVVFTERKRTWVSQPGQESSLAKRKREKAHPRLLAPLNHEGSIRPLRNEKYLKILQNRRLESEKSLRPIVQLDDSKMSQAKLNQLASGFANATSTLGKGMIASESRVAPGERFARLEKHELTDRLFSLFSEKPYWSITALKATLQQPDAWLREVLKDVATLIKEGQYANMWELRDNWKDMGAGSTKTEKDGAKVEKDEGEESDDDDEEEDDDDLELVEV